MLCIFAYENIKYIKNMIHTVSNPQMTPAEIRSFRENFVRCVSKNITPKELSEVKDRQKRMKKTYDRIISNNGGKNPILGY